MKGRRDEEIIELCKGVHKENWERWVMLVVVMNGKVVSGKIADVVANWEVDGIVKSRKYLSNG